MNQTGQVPAIVGSLEELLAVAVALEQEATALWRDLSALTARQGDAVLAAQFLALAEIEDGHVALLGDRGLALLGHRPDPARVRGGLPAGQDDAAVRGALTGAYQALAFAVRNEERAFAFYTYVAAEAASPAVRSLAEELAREELGHAASLRVDRRRAFHANRPEAANLPETVGALHELARLWDTQAAVAHRALADVLEAAGEAGDAALFRGLASAEAAAGNGAIVHGGAASRDRAEGLRLLERIFDRYASIAERSGDEHVVAEAQRLAAIVIGRLSLAKGSPGTARPNGDA